MKNFKFRAWNIKKKKMMYGIEHAYDGSGAESIKGNDYEDSFGLYLGIDNYYRIGRHHYKVMQYIGIKDTNDKEIYERDLISSNLYKNKEVFFRAGSFCIYIAPGTWLELSQLGSEWTIMGNVFENPELQKEE